MSGRNVPAEVCGGDESEFFEPSHFGANRGARDIKKFMRVTLPTGVAISAYSQ